MTEQIDSGNSYYDALDKLSCPSQLMGRVTMQMHYAEPEPFVAADKTPIGRKALHAATRSKGYTISMDTHGTLRWHDAIQDGKPLLVITCENCPKEYLDYLTDRHISWIAVGGERIDLKQAMYMRHKEFGVERIAITGGGHINGAFLEAGLIDEVSVMIGPGIDGRKGMTSVFDGIKDTDRPAIKGDAPVENYDVIFIGYPNWWGDMPMPVYTFIEKHNWQGKTVIPFYTHEGSGLGSTTDKLRSTCKGATIQKGLAMYGHTAQNSREEAKKAVADWLTELKF